MHLFVVVLLVALVLLPEADAVTLNRRRAGRIIRCLHRVPKPDIPEGKRNVGDFDKNKGGNIDQSEAEELIKRGDAQELLSYADENGDSTVSVEEFTRSIHALRGMDFDPGLLDEDFDNE